MTAVASDLTDVLQECRTQLALGKPLFRGESGDITLLSPQEHWCPIATEQALQQLHREGLIHSFQSVQTPAAHAIVVELRTDHSAAAR